jgi:hypothetical protein
MRFGEYPGMKSTSVYTKQLLVRMKVKSSIRNSRLISSI